MEEDYKELGMEKEYMKDVVIYNLNQFIQYCNGAQNFEYENDFKQHKEVAGYIEKLIKGYKALKDGKEFYEFRYKQLRKQWDRMVDTLLGEDYYNDGCDTYSCDEFTIDDLIYKYKKRWWQFWKKK